MRGHCGLCRLVLRTALLCTPILSVTTSLWNIGEAAVAVKSAQTVTIIRDYFTIIAIILPIIRIIPPPKVGVREGGGA
jgi:hypothetical protein